MSSGANSVLLLLLAVRPPAQHAARRRQPRADGAHDSERARDRVAACKHADRSARARERVAGAPRVGGGGGCVARALGVGFVRGCARFEFKLHEPKKRTKRKAPTQREKNSVEILKINARNNKKITPDATGKSNARSNEKKQRQTQGEHNASIPAG